MTAYRLVPAALLASMALLAPEAAFAFFGTTLQPSGKVVSESREAKGFTGIYVSLPGTVVVRQGEPASVSVEADDNLLPEIETTVESGMLKIRFKRSLSLSGRPTLRLLVVAPAIRSLAVAGSGDILSETLSAESLDVSVSGSGDVRVAKLEAGALSTSIAGSGDVRVAGKAANVTVNIAGSGDVRAERLETSRARVSITGSGDVTLWVRDSLDVSTIGSGDVRYHGDPAVKKSSIGSGTVKRLGPAP